MEKRFDIVFDSNCFDEKFYWKGNDVVREISVALNREVKLNQQLLCRVELVIRCLILVVS